MTIFIILIFIVLIFGYIITKGTSGKTGKNKVSTPKAIKKSQQVSPNEKKLYKKKSVRRFNIVGTYYLKLNPDDYGKSFTGYAACKANKHDRYAVGIYDKDGVHIGYVPKGNTILHDSLKEWYNGKVLVWGYLHYDDFERKWQGECYIPVKYSTEEIAKFEELLNLRAINNEQLENKVGTTEEYFQILERHKMIQKYLQELNNPNEFNYYFPKNFIPSVSKHLEKQKEWEKLVELGTYDDLIMDLHEQFRGTTVKRIELAKSKL